MKKALLFFCCFISIFQHIHSQVIKDTVSVGPGYANQVWYNLQSGEEIASPKTNWDLAFSIGGMGYSIYINSAVGTTLWAYPAKDTAAWPTVDTIGIKKWPTQWNSDTSWVRGAFDRYSNPNDQYDLGWGKYSIITHTVIGDSLYVIKLANNTYKKLWIQSLISGTFTIRYANLDNSNDVTAQISKTPYTTKNFVYYSIQNNAIVDREPAKTAWDLTFVQYTAFVPTPYSVAGILQNTGVRVADVRKVNDPATYVSWQNHPLKTAINEIGSDWKTFDLANNTYNIEDSLVYFARTAAGVVWKIIPAGFGGSANGNFIFTKEKMVITNIENTPGTIAASLAVYPNPSNGGTTTIIYDLEKDVTTALLNVIDLSGRMVYSETLKPDAGLYTLSLNTTIFQPGMYLLNLEVDGNRTQQKLIVNP